MSKMLKFKLIVVLLLVIAMLFGGAWWYFHVHTKTPEYALQQIETALTKHETDRFERYVDLDALLDTSYDDFMAGLVLADTAGSEEEKAAIGDFTQMLKAPLLTSLKSAVEQYVATGSWPGASSGSGTALDASQFLEKSGLSEMEYRGLDSLTQDEEKGQATAKIRVFQKEADEEFVFDVELTKQEDGDWRVTRVTNVGDFASFLAKARQAKLKAYADAANAVIARHNETMMKAQEDFTTTLAAGSLGNQQTREALKVLMQDTVVPDWQQRREELSAIDVPAAAQSLQKLRLKICDLHIAYAQGYADWMTDKKAATLRDAERQLAQARTLEQEEKFLARRVGDRAQ